MAQAKRRYYLVKFRKASGLSQIETAKLLSLDRSYYVSIETARRQTTIEVWLSIQKLFKIDDADMWKVITKVRSEDSLNGKKN